MSKLNELRDLLKWKQSKAAYARRLRISELEVENLLKEIREEAKPQPEITEEEGESIAQNLEAGTLRSTKLSSENPTTPEQIIALHKIDSKKWKLSQFWSKQKRDKWIVSALFTAIQVDKDLSLQKDVILDELKTFMSDYEPQMFKPTLNKGTGDHLYEISLPDLHFGKLAHAEEVGQDYDLKIASERANKAVDFLLNAVNTDRIERILFPIGNDLFNVDNGFKTTTAGTPQDCDTRIHKMVKVTTRVMITQIDKMSQIAPVDIPIVVGNHDTIMAFMMGEILDAYYHDNPNVNVFNSAGKRKYYQYYENGFQFTHGNEEKHAELGIIFATEQKKLWADTSFRYCQLGHFHKEKAISYLTGDSFQGFQVEILPSLSGPDAWHNGKGYISNRSAKAFMYHREMGEVATAKYTCI